MFNSCGTSTSIEWIGQETNVSADYHRQKDAAGEDAARRAVEICEEEIARLNVAISEL